MNMIKRNYKKFVFAIILLSGITAVILNNPIVSNDEATLFYDILRMYNGYSIYKDFNVLQTPIFFYIGNILFKIFQPTYLVFRIYGIFIWALLFFNIYKLLKNLKVKNEYIAMFILALFFFLINNIKIGANYNILAIAISIYAINWYLKSDNNKLNMIFGGVICLIIFLIKQPIGVYHFIGFVICELLKNKKISRILIYILSMIICTLIYGIWLYFTGSLQGFIDYTILGMLDFKQNRTVESYIILLTLINLIIFIIAWRKQKLDYNAKVLFVYSIIMLLIGYPILCDVHSRMALIYSGISFVYILFIICSNIKIKKENEKIYITLYYIIIFFMLGILITKTISSLMYWQKNFIKEKEDLYYGAIFDQRMEDRINSVVEYIKNSNSKVIIVSPEAPLYNIRLKNVNNGILDYPVQGNCGINGEEKIIKAISDLSNTKLIITKYIYYQEHINVHKYIIENYKKTDEIMGVFEVYE